MILLAIESSGRQGGVALLDGTSLRGQVQLSGATPQGRRILPALQWLLGQTGLRPLEIGAVAVSVGPGSFTGLRVGVAAAKSLAWSLNVPLAAVGTLEALAAQAAPGTVDALILPLLDARNQAVHAGFFSPQPLAGLAPDTTEPLKDVLDHATALADSAGLSGILPLGEGWQRYQQAIAAHLGERLRWPHPLLATAGAFSVGLIGLRKIQQGDVTDPALLEPVYQSKGVPAW